MRRRLLARVMLLFCLLLPGHASWLTVQAAADTPPVLPLPPAPLADPVVFPVYIPYVARTVPFAAQQSAETFLPLVMTDMATSDHPVEVVPVAGPPV